MNDKQPARWLDIGVRPAPVRAAQALLALRLLLAGLLAIHGWARWIHGGVAPFGEWLGGQGFPLGLQLAWAVTLLEVLGTPLLALGWRVRWLAACFAGIYTIGLVLVHWPAGWFVVGLGRNGMEYSVLLIAGLLALAWAHPSQRRSAATAD